MPLISNPASAIPARLQGLHLFHYDGAPCAQRVRFVLGEKGLRRGREERFDAVSDAAVRAEDNRWVSRSVSLAKRDHMSQTYAEIHPDMVVPALVHDGRLYLESLDIIEYLDDAFGGPRLIPTEASLRSAVFERVEQAKVLHLSIRYVTFRWGLGGLARLSLAERQKLADLARNGNDGENLVQFYNGYSNRSIPEAVYENHLQQLYSAFCEVDSTLSDGRPFLTGDALTIADAFWAMKILRLIECGYPVHTQHPALYRWYASIAARPSFRNEVMGKNRLASGAFRLKAGVESLLGIGLRRAVQQAAFA